MSNEENSRLETACLESTIRDAAVSFYQVLQYIVAENSVHLLQRLLRAIGAHIVNLQFTGLYF